MKSKTIILTLMMAMAMITMNSRESSKVKENRKTYMEFLKGMSDAPEFLKIKSEIVNDDDPSGIYFIVEFETKYCGRELKDKVKIQFIGDFMHRFDGVWPDTYKSSYLLNIIKN